MKIYASISSHFMILPPKIVKVTMQVRSMLLTFSHTVINKERLLKKSKFKFKNIFKVAKLQDIRSIQLPRVYLRPPNFMSLRPIIRGICNPNLGVIVITK